MIIVDAHQDLAWNILTFNRDYTRPAVLTRQLEIDSLAQQHNGDTLLGWEDYQQGKVGLIFATLFAAPQRACMGAWDHQCYANDQQAHTVYSAQLDAYKRLVEENPDKYRLVLDQKQLNEVVKSWQDHLQNPNASQGSDPDRQSRPPVGLVVLMEGAEGVREPAELEWWQQRGVRIIGPAWAGTRYCGGTKEPGPMTKEGFALLKGMADFGFALDLSHMDEKAALQALDIYPGQIIASHSNAAAPFKVAVDSNRHLSERLIHGLIEREAVIGVVVYNSFLKPDWRKGDRRSDVGLDRVIAQIDHICQIAGDAHHVGIGSDFDGGFGWQSVPDEINTIADLRKLIPLLHERGYAEPDIEAILGKNWIAKLQQILK
jgi:membrane dipeptidase